MRIINPDNINKAEIVIGIPSLNEADSIGFVVTQIDQGLGKYFSDRKSVIVNVDNNSQDGTKEAFLNTQTHTPKIYISTPENVKGKGNNLRNLFTIMRELGAKAGATVDADLKSITPKWINCLISPILKENYHFLTPLYYRHKYDATITNHICYPLVYGILGYNIRQPIGGDMAFSREMTEFWLNQGWPPEVSQYGIDIFMTLNAIKSQLKIGQVNLVAKIHKPSAPKLGPMFLAVAKTLFDFLSANKEIWNDKEMIDVPVVCSVDYQIHKEDLFVDKNKIKETAVAEFRETYKMLEPELDNEIKEVLENIFIKKEFELLRASNWAKVVYHLLNIYCSAQAPKRGEIINFLRALYFGRIAAFISEVEDLDDEKAEESILNQAKIFRKEFLSQKNSFT